MLTNVHQDASPLSHTLLSNVPQCEMYYTVQDATGQQDKCR
jgi:hypothetical protein